MASLGEEGTTCNHKLMITMGEGWGEGIVRKFGVDIYKLLYLKCIAIKALLCSTGNPVQCYAEVWVGGEFGENR